MPTARRDEPMSRLESLDSIELKTPVTDEAIRKVRSGDIIYITGHVWTIREGAFIRLCIEGKPLPVDAKKFNVFQIGGQMMRKDVKGAWITPALGSGSTGLRFARFVPDLIQRYGIKAYGSGKCAMGDIPEIVDTCKKFGCITYTTHPRELPGSPRGIGGRVRAKAVTEVHWLDLGSNDALWLYEVEKLGPMICNIDTRGNTYFNTGGPGVGSADEIDRRAEEIFKKRKIDKLYFALDREHPKYPL